MKRVYHKYTEWEDYKNGMFSHYDKSKETHLIELAVHLLSNEDLFLKVCNKVIENWIISTEENLTNKSCNRQAWLGQACCCYQYNVPESLTRIAWSKLTDIQRLKANNIAYKVINSYEVNYRLLHKGMGEQMLFRWDT